ncbi:hypothetical protein PR202_gb08585 [Eleusine coracana subsp. coracana]|uniref:Reverse transcriptase zinc-binding domain-containing protein n=1 Tax=Eleusine coracana subsp. coracana TaxID=191504 RepID=A0AAV5EFB9_ELECO|nr:hypothetical protein PR202_gb08585 [Eleusine coracana subsp. coracana]
MESAAEVKNALQLYCRASGQQVNTDKSSIYFAKGCSKTLRGEIKEVLDIHNEALIEKYLGMPIEVGSLTYGAFKYIKDRVWQRVQRWMEQCLSAGGKEVLIKSVVQALPTYSMSCFRLPWGLCKHIDGLLCNFWWGSKGGKRRMNWVAWDDMTIPKYMGGLGFRNMELFNLALLAKQGWRVMQNPEALNARVLKVVYFPHRDFLEATVGANPSRVWRAIMDGKDVLKQGIIRRIGSGSSTNIWQSNWLPREGFLRPLCSLVDQPPQWVSELITQDRQWNKELLRDVFIPMDIEAIESIPICTASQEDFWGWQYEKNRIFSARSAYRMLVHTSDRRSAWIEHRAGISDLKAVEKDWTEIWKVQVSSKIRVFLWRLARQSLPTGDVRNRRNMAPNASCSLCGGCDSWRHSLLECNMAKVV